MVPTLKVPIGLLKEHNFIDAYTIDSNQEHPYENAAYLLFKPKNLESFNSFLQNEYERTEKLIDDYDYENGHVVLVYLLDLIFFHDFELVKKGQYSKTSKDFQKLFPKNLNIIINSEIEEEESLQHAIFRKSETLRNIIEKKIGETLPDDIEVWEMFDINKETLKL